MHLDCLINCLYTRSCAPPPPACLQHGSRDASRVACNSDTSPAALPSCVHTMLCFNLQSDQRLCADGPCADMPTDKYTNLMFHFVQCYCVLWNTNIYFRVNSFMSFDPILNQTISALFLINLQSMSSLENGDCGGCCGNFLCTSCFPNVCYISSLLI